MAVLVWALEEGKQLILIRKGGIGEEKQFLFYPRYEHSDEVNVRPEFREQMETHKRSPVGQGKVRVSSWAELDEVIKTKSPEEVQALDSYYIWPRWHFRKDFMVKRGFTFEEWEEEYYDIQILRVYMLSSPIVIDDIKDREYICSCHIPYTTLPHDVSAEGSTPVLSDEKFLRLKEEIKSILAAKRIQVSRIAS